MKTRSIRAEETVLEQFKELSEQFPNQSMALESLLNAYKMQTAKANVVTRQTEIENFDSHLQVLSAAFLNSIELTENTKQRIRGEFQQQLESKDKTIIELQSKEETVNATSAELKKKLKEIESETKAEIAAKDEIIKQLTNKLFNAETALSKAEQSISDKQIIINSLNEQLAALTISAEKIAQAENQVKAAEASQKKAESRTDELNKQLEDEKKSHQQDMELAAKNAEIAKQQADLELQKAVFNAKSKLQDKVSELLEKISIQAETISELKVTIAEMRVVQTSPFA
ncbi:MAG: hypothetical protein K2I00_09930 [Ruminococcus sp.]|nr:hypothetical protein [Ruminococcus sp.]